MDANLVTSADLDRVAKRDLQYIIDIIHPKVRAAFPPGSQSSFLECSNYDTVYITSDIHSDLRKFMQILMSLELIPTKTIDKVRPVGSNYGPIYEPIYNYNLISDVEWIGGAKILFVIVGDLVDGKRNEERSVDDPKGTFEILLFLLLHNLRIQAHKVGSDIRYTMGNHELDSCVAIQEEFYDNYVTDQVKRYFSSPQNRNLILMPFLQASPSIILSLAHGKNNELICIHGGLHEDEDTGTRGTDLTKYLIKTQTILDRARDLHTFMGTVTKNIISNGELSRGAWTRLYSEDDPEVCAILEKSAYPFTVVGHCPTINTNRTLNIFTRNPAYAHCDKGEDEGHTGCVITDCNKDGAPTLAMVDTGMSAGFRARDPAKNQSRKVEVLKLTHDAALKSSRYYNIIEATTGESTRLMYKAGTKLNSRSSALVTRRRAPPVVESPAVFEDYHPPVTSPPPANSPPPPSIPPPAPPPNSSVIRKFTPKPPSIPRSTHIPPPPSIPPPAPPPIIRKFIPKPPSIPRPKHIPPPSNSAPSSNSVNGDPTSLSHTVSSNSAPSSNSATEDTRRLSFNDPPVAVGGKRRSKRRSKKSKRTRKAKKRN